MTKSGSEHLFLLIKSLSQSEKRFFKLWAQLHASERNNKYTRLFDAIQKQDVYDEKKLFIDNKDVAYGKQFPVLKNYLYNQILWCMDQYHKSKYEEVRSLLHKVEFLCEKGLYEQCDKMLRKAKQKAEQNNMLHYSLELFRPWEKILVLQSNDMERMKKFLAEEKKISEQLLRTQQYDALENQMYIYYLQSHGKEVESIVNQAKIILQDPLIKRSEKKFPF